ncbi:uncharacterized protein LOC129598025 [Paramacrobiotus metropolitanus]|uniref:uncharacterized protein LOC129598025 n=1 Tax=Paramacrobiotus metropolitanus TaxID=2943436 RepID=UPI002445B628|nr:uncharacterized protein LOC129598025 [Paramacrobiotus metropolitanus]
MSEEGTLKDETIDQQEISEEDAINIEEPLTGEKRKKIHFSIDFDNELLKTVIQENPYDYAGKDRTLAWNNVSVALDDQLGTSGLLPRTCKDRCERLISYYEKDHPFLKTPTDALGKNRERLGLLDRLTKLRKESGARLWNAGSANKIIASPARKLRSARNPRTSTSSELGGTVSAYQLAGTPLSEESSEKSAHIVLNGVNAEALLNGQDGTTYVMSKSRPIALASGVQNLQIEGPYTIPYTVNSSGLESHERSLIKELIEARRAEDVRRREEIELRREELEVKKMKLELERAQWEADRKERDDRLVMEQQERKILLELMKKVLCPQTASDPPTE